MDNDELFDANLLEQTIDGLISQGKRNFALDLSNIEYIYSDSINKFINLNHKILNVYGRLALLGPQAEVMQILQRAGIQNFITIYSNMNEIIQASEQMIQQTSAINTADVQNFQPQQQAPQQNEFDDLRSEIGNVMEVDDATAPDVGIQDSSFAQPTYQQPQQQQFQQPTTQQVPVQPAQPTTQQVPIQPIAEPEPFQPAAPAQSAAPLPDFDNVDDSIDEEDRFETQKKSSGLPVAAIILLIISFLTLAGVGGYFFLTKSKSSTPKTVKKVETPEISKEIPEIPEVPEIDEKPVAQKKTTPATKTVTRKATPKKTYTPAKKSPPNKTVSKSNSIVITSSPAGAKVLFNKKVLGTTPYTWKDPTAYGMISIAVEKDGYEAKNMNFEYTGGSSTKHFTLVKKKVTEKPVTTTKPAASTPAATTPKPTTTTPVATPTPKPATTPKPAKPAGEPGSIFISSLPPMADVYMDGVKIGKTNIAELKITAGEHTMRFVKGAKETTKKMTFKPGKNPSQLIRLK